VLFRVHIDTLDPQKVQQFEGARLAWLQSLTKEGAADAWRGSYYAVDDHAFLSLRPLTRLGDLDPHAMGGPKPSPEAVKAYNDLSDEGLVFPHFTQVWMADEELSYRPPSHAVALDGHGRGTWVLDAVEPNRSEAYGQAWAEVHRALASIAYPVAHLCFASRVGDGRTSWLWLARDDASFESAPSFEVALENAVGAARAFELLKELAKAVAATESHALRGKPAMSDP
jgi:hypothetical protein